MKASWQQYQAKSMEYWGENGGDKRTYPKILLFYQWKRPYYKILPWLLHWCPTGSLRVSKTYYLNVFKRQSLRQCRKKYIFPYSMLFALWSGRMTVPLHHLPFTVRPLTYSEYTTYTKKQQLYVTAVFYACTMIYKNNNYDSPGIGILLGQLLIVSQFFLYRVNSLNCLTVQSHMNCNWNSYLPLSEAKASCHYITSGLSKAPSQKLLLFTYLILPHLTLPYLITLNIQVHLTSTLYFLLGDLGVKKHFNEISKTWWAMLTVPLYFCFSVWEDRSHR